MVKKIIPAQTYKIRRKVLRNNDPLASVEFDGDSDETTIHLGYFEKEELCGIVTMIQLDENTCQMRGMAVLDNYQGKNIGKNIVQYAEELLKEKKIKQVVFNARIKAVGFYQKLGYKIISNEFDIPEVGIHVKMAKNFDE